MNAQELLQEISDYCRQSGLAESTFGRRAVNDGKLTSRLRNGGRITTETLDRIRSFMSANAGMQGHRPMVIERMRAPGAERRQHARAAPRRVRRVRHRSGRQFPLLRQSSKISAVREYLQREMGGREPRRARTRQYPSASAGRARVRCRHGRRHGAHARDARDASPLSEHAVLYLRQGDQPRGHPPHAREDARPFLRASVHRARPHQHVLFGSAVAHGEVGRGGRQPRVERGGAHRQHLARFRGADHRPAGFSWRRTGKPASAPKAAIRFTRSRSCWCSTGRITNSCSIRSSRIADRRDADFDLVIASQPYRARASAEFKARK